jgi:imidazolonepropionase-like amidohydrolase
MGHDAPIAIVGGLIIDGTERDPIEPGILIIEGGRLAAVGEARHMSLPRGARRIDAAGKVLTPGLIDAHMHFFGSRSPDPREWVLEPPMLNCVRAVSDAWKILDVGITTIRDLGSRNSIALRNAVSEGAILGPRVVAAGLGLSQTCGHGDVHQLPKAWVCDGTMMAVVCDGVDAVRRVVREQLREGADLIKFWATGGTMSEKDSLEHQHYSDEEMRAIVGEAHRFGRRVAAHAEGIAGTRAALAAGVDSIEHGFELDEAVCAEMKAKGVALVATLALLDRVVNTPGVPEYAKAKARPLMTRHFESFRLAHAMGVKIGMGCDAFADPVTPFGAYNIHEFELLIAGGMTPREALIAATRTNAEILGLSGSVGTLEVGKAADFLILAGNPLDDPTVLTRPGRLEQIFLGGRPVRRRGPDLYETLA